MRHSQARPKRRGAAMAEVAVIGLLFLMLIMGLLDLGIGVYRYNLVCQAARQGARQAIVHGALAPSQIGSWGPATYGPTPASGSNAIAVALQPYLTGIEPSTVTIKYQWLDGDNQFGHRVQVTVTYSYKPMMTFIFGSPTYNLGTVSTMRIAH